MTRPDFMCISCGLSPPQMTVIFRQQQSHNQNRSSSAADDPFVEAATSGVGQR